MALTEKGTLALDYIQKYFPKGKFTAKDLSDACGEKIVAATLNGVANNGYVYRYETVPITFELKENIDLSQIIETEKKKKNNSNNDNLHKALKIKNDEFYTFYEDIEKECQNYTEHFNNKIIYLNCDDENSNFWKYFLNNFQKFKLKELIATHLNESGISYKISTLDGTTIVKQWLEGNGDFSSKECQDIIDASDVVITNPPFSRFREIVITILKYNKKFLLIGNENTFASTEIFPLIKDNIIWTGFNKVATFLQPDETTKDFGNICWFTNLKINKQIPFITLKEKYNPKFYPKYDNYDAINIDRVEMIPNDYFEPMGIPISYLNKYNPEQFEILGLAAGNSKIHKLYFSIPYKESPLDRGGCGVINGIRKYSRVFVKRKK